MEKSESIKNLSKALITFHLKVDKVKKDAKNPFFKSSYASLSNILDAINEPLIESGLSFAQFPTGEYGLTTILLHGETGEFIQSTYDMKPVKDDPQGRGSVITYQRRYALASVLGLNIDDDDDGNSGSRVPAYQKKPITSYNHNSLEKNGLPLISNAQFKQLMERLSSGDIEAADKAYKAFSFEATQKGILDREYKKQKEVTA